jgi:5-methylcytosine-specific restriction endonuclease McrA
MTYNKASYEKHREKRLADAKERRKTLNAEQRERINAKSRERIAARGHVPYNKASQDKRTKAYRESHPDKVPLWSEAYYKAHREEISARNKASYVTQREKRLDYFKAYRAANREKIAAKAKAYQQTHRDKVRVNAATRLARKIENGGSHTADEWHALCDWFGNVCLCCGAPGKLVVDHVIPVVNGGTSAISNLQPLCKPCNSKKHVRTIDYRDPGLLADFLATHVNSV